MRVRTGEKDCASAAGWPITATKESEIQYKNCRCGVVRG